MSCLGVALKKNGQIRHQEEKSGESKDKEE